jgi:hypothetical protein
MTPMNETADERKTADETVERRMTMSSTSR